jgi:uncharacterized Zn finger protein
MMSDLQRTGWGARWIESLERLATAWQSRLPRGRDYADKGHVISLSVSAGRIAARVQGSRSKPYSTTIDVGTFREADWERIARRLASQARWSAELLAGHITPDAENLFSLENLNLFPSRNSEMLGNCSCPDKNKPCKHIAAVHYAFGSALDRDPFLLFQLRGLDQATMFRLFRKAWFGQEADTSSADDVIGNAEKGMLVMSLTADRFNRSPDAVEQMSFNMVGAGGSPLLILGRLGAPPSWTFPLPISELVGDIYAAATQLAVNIALAEPVREELVVDGLDEDLESEFELEDDDDDEDYDEFDDADGDGDGLDDEQDEPAPTLRVEPTQDYKSLSSSDRVIDGRAFPFGAPATRSVPAAVFSPSADLFLPKSLAAVTEVPGYKPPEKEDDRSSVLIRKGVATIQKRRTRKGETGTLASSVESVPVLMPSTPELPPPTPAPAPAIHPGLPGSVVAVKRDAPPPGPMVRKRRVAGEDDALSPLQLAPPAPAPMPQTASVPAPAQAAASTASSGTEVRIRGRRVVDPTMPQASEPPSPPTPALPSYDAGDDSMIRRRGRKAASETAGIDDVPTLGSQDVDRIETLCRRALESGDGVQALQTARQLWQLQPNETRFLMLMSAADLATETRMVVTSEADLLQARILRTGRLSLAELLLTICAGRMEMLANLFVGMGEHAWMHDELALVFIPAALVWAISDEQQIVEQSALATLWDELFSRGESLFDDMGNPPAPLGVWLQWAMSEFPLERNVADKLVRICRELLDELVNARGLINTDQRSGQAAQLIAALLETWTIQDRGEEGRSFLASIRPAIATRRRLVRSLEEAIEASALLND